MVRKTAGFLAIADQSNIQTSNRKKARCGNQHKDAPHQSLLAGEAV